FDLSSPALARRPGFLRLAFTGGMLHAPAQASARRRRDLSTIAAARKASATIGNPVSASMT
ncbi:hypothetical protein, partial [Escherichia coli]|uniref:hypothetical protein n=1 Tax=Escherichia coli TaxID=562 RepID=UPI001BEADF43